MISLSVIVPVYNAEAYLTECLDSICPFLTAEMEMILINDGSTDRSGEICRTYAEKYPQIRLVEQKNAGAVLVRNRGLDMAQGEYIGFLDADDKLSPSFFSAMLHRARETGCDICCCPIQQFTREKFLPFYDDRALLAFLERTNGNVEEEKDCLWEPGWIWRKIFRRSMLTENKIRFRSGIQILEDLLFSSEAIFAAKTIAYCPDATYYYRLEVAESQCTIRDNRLLSLFELCRLIMQQCPRRDLPIGATLTVRTLLYGYSRLGFEYRRDFLEKLRNLPMNLSKLAQEGAGYFKIYYRDSRKMRLSNQIATSCFCAALVLTRKEKFRAAEFFLNFAAELAIRGGLRARLKHPISLIKRIFPASNSHRSSPAQ